MSLLKTYGLFIAACACLLFACNKGDNGKVGDIPVARVGNSYLYISELLKLEVPGKTEEDSVSFVNNYVERWIKSKLFLTKASEFLPEGENNVEQQVEDYRTSLVSYLYEKYLISQNLDVNVSEDIIENYYDTYKENFVLTETVYKPKFIVIDEEQNKIDSIRSWIKDNSEYSKEAFSNIAIQLGERYSTGEDWFSFDDFVKDLPQERLRPERLLKQDDFQEFKKDGFIYMLRTVDFGIKDSIAPLDYKKQDIEKIIVNKRKTDYLTKTKDRIYNDAINKKDFEIFDVDE